MLTTHALAPPGSSFKRTTKPTQHGESYAKTSTALRACFFVLLVLDGCWCQQSSGNASTAGTLRWAFDAHSTVDSTPTLSRDQTTVYVGCPCRLYAVSTNDGSMRWQFATPHYACTAAIPRQSFCGVSGCPRSSPALSEDQATVYVGSDDTNLYAVNTADGSRRWKYATGDSVRSNPVVSSPTRGQATVYVGSYDGSVYAVNAADGSLRWKFLTRDNVRIHSSPTLSRDQGTLYIGSDDKFLYAINATDGSRRWRFATSDRVMSASVCFDLLSPVCVAVHTICVRVSSDCTRTLSKPLGVDAVGRFGWLRVHAHWSATACVAW